MWKEETDRGTEWVCVCRLCERKESDGVGGCVGMICETKRQKEGHIGCLQAVKRRER